MTNPTTKCARNTSNFNETSNLKLLVNFISVFEGVWVKFEKKRKSHFVLHIYRRADNNFQENWWPRRYILRLLLFLQPLSGGRRTRLTIRYYCETSRLVYLAVVQTSWSCQSKCQRLRAALLLHNFPLSWNYVKHVNRVVYGFKPFHRALISTLIFLLLLCGFCVAVKYKASLQKCNLVTDAIWKLVWSHLQHTWWGKASLLKADKANRARAGQMLPPEPLKSIKPKSEERKAFICNKDFEHRLFTTLWKRRKYVVGLALQSTAK